MFFEVLAYESTSLEGTGAVKGIPNEASDEVLVTAAKVGELSAFSELWSRHSKRVFNTSYRITGNRQDAEDVLQDAFLKAFIHLETFDGRAAFFTWITRIAINSALGILRKKRTRREMSLEWSADGENRSSWEIPDSREDIEHHYEKEEARQQLRRAINRLQPSLRDALGLQQSRDISVNEIAKITGISVPAAKSRLLRARKQLRRSMSSST
jgi:RNA polymerase sigma factor (sigma-70 family)